jgi:hypothetical protein
MKKIFNVGYICAKNGVMKRIFSRLILASLAGQIRVTPSRRPAARSVRAPLGDGWSEDGGAALTPRAGRTANPARRQDPEIAGFSHFFTMFQTLLNLSDDRISKCLGIRFIDQIPFVDRPAVLL